MVLSMWGSVFVSNLVGNSFTAWDGYIEGRNLELKPDEKIIQHRRKLMIPVFLANILAWPLAFMAIGLHSQKVGQQVPVSSLRAE